MSGSKAAWKMNLSIRFFLRQSSRPFLPPKNYTLERCLSTNQLIKKYSEMIGKAQRDYFEKLEEADLLLKQNLLTAEYMDSIFGELDTKNLHAQVSRPSRQDTQQDGSKRLTCPILSCNIKTFKLKRHLQTVHHTLSCGSIDVAMQMSKLITDNSYSEETNSPLPICSEPTTRAPKPNLITGLVKRKDNFKRCLLCESLVINMTNYISVRLIVLQKLIKDILH